MSPEFLSSVSAALGSAALGPRNSRDAWDGVKPSRPRASPVHPGTGATRGRGPSCTLPLAPAVHLQCDAWWAQPGTLATQRQ